MAKTVLRDLTTSIQSAPFISIMIGETTDEANKEQVVICFRCVDDNLNVHEDFIGLHETESTEAVALLTIIHDVLNRLNISITKQELQNSFWMKSLDHLHTLLWSLSKLSLQLSNVRS